MHDFASTQLTVIDQNARNRAAEDAARAHRLDLDRVISAALSALWAQAHKAGVSALCEPSRQANAYLSGYVFDGGETRDVLSLIDEIRASLSPLVR